ncbi:MAG: OmpH family outer membrane protein [Candidatus Sumerlaeia bacterium]
MMKYIKRIGLILAAAMLLSLPLLAQNPSEEKERSLRIAFVDVDEITRNSTFIRGILKSLEDSISGKREELDAKQAELKKLLAEMEQKKAVLSEAQFDKMVLESRNLRLDLENMQYELQKSLRKAEQEKMMPALDFILRTIEEVGQEENYDLILRGEVVLYGAKQVNLTKKVIDKIDSNPPSLKEMRQK